MKFTAELPDEKISNLLCSAFEGGSNYWYQLVDWTQDHNGILDYDGMVDPEKYLKWSIKDWQDTEGVGLYQLDYAALFKGLRIMAAKYPAHMGDAIRGEDDAETGDVFLQCCLFGDIVYG